MTFRKTLAAAALGLSLPLFAPHAVRAEEPRTPSPVASSGQAFDAALPALPSLKEEPVDGQKLLVIAYVVFWALAAGYLAQLALAQRRLRRDLDALQRRVDGDRGGT